MIFTFYNRVKNDIHLKACFQTQFIHDKKKSKNLTILINHTKYKIVSF